MFTVLEQLHFSNIQKLSIVKAIPAHKKTTSALSQSNLKRDYV